jgi:hypothetical protein
MAGKTKEAHCQPVNGALQQSAPGRRRPLLRGWVEAMSPPVALIGAVPMFLGVVTALAIALFGPAQVPPRAAIIDQLSLTDPNPGFVQRTTAVLTRAGYEVHYYRWQSVTVDLYRHLPEMGYSYIIIRSHSAVGHMDPTAATASATGLFTTEPFTFERHVDDLRARALVSARLMRRPTETTYFGITPAFVERRMRGNFRGATVIAMGCDGLTTQALATAFHRRGAGNFIAWGDSVTAEHTDLSTERLLRYLVTERLSAEQAVARTMQEVGPDPVFGARLMSSAQSP